jgi:hypothetical protein
MPEKNDPARIALGIALPTNEQEWSHHPDGRPRDFARLHRSPPFELFERLERVRKLSSQVGIGRIACPLAAHHLGSLFEDSDVVVLLGHSPRAGELELADTDLDATGFLARMPPFTGCLDLSACYSEELANPIRLARGCLVVGLTEPLKSFQALALYLHTLLGVIEGRGPYAKVRANLLVEWAGLS